jgi:hypothetical protein
MLQFTDTHLMPDPDASLRGVRTQASLAACLAHARRRHLVALTVTAAPGNGALAASFGR